MNQSYYFMAQEPKQHAYQDPRYAKYEKYGDREELEAEIERDAMLLYKKKQLEKIENFEGYFEFLRSDYKAPVYFEGEVYPTAAHAFYAAKSEEPHIRKRVQKAPILKEMYNVARTIPDPEGWNHKKLKVMEIITRDKFRRNKNLRERLQATEQRELINTLKEKNEENFFWGIVGKNGQNQLGRILEKVRQSIQDESEVEAWIQHSFKLVQERRSLPTINLDVSRDGTLIESITLENKSFFIFGAHPKKCDVILKHPSISRVHSAIIVDYDLGCIIVDLNSKAGTKLDGQALEGCIPAKINNNQVIIFGQSTRAYKITIDYSKMQREAEIMKKNLEREVKLLNRLDDPNLDADTLKSTLGLIRQDTIYVSNLPYSCTEKDLRELFGDCGKITSIRVPEDHETKMNKGFAFVQFENEKGFKKALNYDGHKFFGRRLKVSKAEKKIEIEERLMKKNEEKKEYYNKESRGKEDRRKDKYRDRREGRRGRSRSRSGERGRRRYEERDRRDKKKDKKRRRSPSSSSSSSDDRKSSSSQSSKSSGFEAGKEND